VLPTSRRQWQRSGEPRKGRGEKVNTQARPQAPSLVSLPFHIERRQASNLPPPSLRPPIVSPSCLRRRPSLSVLDLDPAVPSGQVDWRSDAVRVGNRGQGLRVDS
jgi:hypothetical protein